jgi:hypothetical protein
MDCRPAARPRVTKDLLNVSGELLADYRRNQGLGTQRQGRTCFGRDAPHKIRVKPKRADTHRDAIAQANAPNHHVRDIVTLAD